MNYAQIRKFDTANGKGIRTSLFVSGCTHNCYNCFNKEYQDFSYGNAFTKSNEDLIISYLKLPVIRGLTLLGGEPMEQNSEEMCKFLFKVRKELSMNESLDDEKIKKTLNHIKNQLIVEKFDLEEEKDMYNPNELKDIWIYSGFTFEEIVENKNRLEILKYCDVLVDGRFVEKLKNLRLKFRGSENQRIIDVRKSLVEGKIIEISKVI